MRVENFVLCCLIVYSLSIENSGMVGLINYIYLLFFRTIELKNCHFHSYIQNVYIDENALKGQYSFSNLWSGIFEQRNLVFSAGKFRDILLINSLYSVTSQILL